MTWALDHRDIVLSIYDKLFNMNMGDELEAFAVLGRVGFEPVSAQN
jgi:hypothetical protein